MRVTEKVVPFPGANADVPVTEDALACLVSEEHGRDIRYCPQQGRWLVWTGARWEPDETGLVFEMCRNVCRTFVAKTTAAKWGKRAAVAAVEGFCETDASLIVNVNDLDTDPMLLGTPNGVVDLRSGRFLPPNRDHLITRSAVVDPAEDGEPDLWLSFLNDATKGDAELIRFLQRMAGYALTGITRDHSLFFVYGSGGNGKGTFLNVLRDILGTYAAHASIQVFTGGMNSRHPTELAMLRGARLVTASETEQGESWAEGRIKELTGGDPVTARFMRQDFFTFIPSFKLVIIGNHRPVLQSVDDAAKRRFRIIPFKNKPMMADSSLGESLKPEYPAILRWMIAGCLDWQSEDIPLPEVVQSETFDYFEDQDALGQWLKECCDTDASGKTDENSYRCMSSKLFASWAQWCKDNGEKAGTNKSFSESVKKYGFRKKRGSRGAEFFGVRVRPQEGMPYTMMQG